MKRLELIQAREAKALTQRDVAEAVDITESYYGMIEAGVRTPRFRLGLQIAKFLGVDPERVFFSPDGQQNVGEAADERAAAAEA